MAKKRFLVVEDSFIGMRLIKADMPVEQRIVEIETDVDAGGMIPASNLVECDETGEPIVAPKPKSKSKAAAAAPATDGGSTDDLA